MIGNIVSGLFSYQSPTTVTGGTQTSDATYNYATFNTSDNLTISGASLTADILVIGGGAGGYYGSTVAISDAQSIAGIGGGGGGGAGKYIYQASQVFVPDTYAVTIGSGGSLGQTFYGSYATAPTAGGTTTVGSIFTATGGSIGGDGYGTSGAASGGSGGTSGNSYSGGAGGSATYAYGGGGGGSASAGTSSNTGATGFIGGAGTANSISGTSITYAWGGTAPNSANTAPADAPGRGGFGGYDLNAPTYGNLQYSAGGAGTKGIVIVRWLK
jgi:hypothetical protein